MTEFKAFGCRLNTTETEIMRGLTSLHEGK